MNEFRLFAHGEAFDVDAFLSSTTLRPDYVWRRGDQRRYACVECRHRTSGIEFMLGDGLKVPLWKQERIAIEYLSANRETLKALAEYRGVTWFILGLQYYIELDPRWISRNHHPAKMLRQGLRADRLRVAER
jgi:hypothetical protein